MREAKATRYVTVSTEQGIHARAAVLIAETVRRFQAEVEICKGHERANGKNILQIMTLGAEHGARLRLEASGPDANAAVAALAELISMGLRRIEQEDTQKMTEGAQQRKKRRASQ
jgi:phosphotransferase system HPr (HPr) family protein